MFVLRSSKLVATLALTILAVTRIIAEENPWHYSLLYSKPMALPALSAAWTAPEMALFGGQYRQHPTQAVEICYQLDRSPLMNTLLTGRISSRLPTVHPGYGQCFEDDFVGRSLDSGTGLEDPGYAYVKFRFCF